MNKWGRLTSLWMMIPRSRAPGAAHVNFDRFSAAEYEERILAFYDGALAKDALHQASQHAAP
jgi:hypothetical protein